MRTNTLKKFFFILILSSMTYTACLPTYSFIASLETKFFSIHDGGIMIVNIANLQAYAESQNVQDLRVVLEQETPTGIVSVSPDSSVTNIPHEYIVIHFSKESLGVLSQGNAKLKIFDIIDGVQQPYPAYVSDVFEIK